MKRRITRISVETEREFIAAERPASSESWCPRCGKAVAVIDHSETESLPQLSSNELDALIERDDLHVVEVNGKFLICSNSLADQNTRRK